MGCPAEQGQRPRGRRPLADISQTLCSVALEGWQTALHSNPPQPAGSRSSAACPPGRRLTFSISLRGVLGFYPNHKSRATLKMVSLQSKCRPEIHSTPARARPPPPLTSHTCKMAAAGAEADGVPKAPQGSRGAGRTSSQASVRPRCPRVGPVPAQQRSLRTSFPAAP